MWRKNNNLTSPSTQLKSTPDYVEKVWHCSKDVGTVRITPSNPQWIPPYSSSSLPDKVNFQFCAYYYESPKQPTSHPKTVDLKMDLLLHRPANTSEKQPITHLKPWISANPTDTRKKLKFALFFYFSTQINVTYAEWSSSGISKCFCLRAK